MNSSLKHHLDNFLATFPKERHVANDPVQFVHRYDDPRDREVAGLIASAFAYGNVKIVLATVERALSYLGPRPAQALSAFHPGSDARRLRVFYHRFNTNRDLGVFCWMIRRVSEEHVSIETAFSTGLGATESDTANAIDRFRTLMLSFGHEAFYPRGELKRRIAVRFLLPTPSD